jgi:hypothetical protein
LALAGLSDNETQIIQNIRRRLQFGNNAPPPALARNPAFAAPSPALPSDPWKFERKIVAVPPSMPLMSSSIVPPSKSLVSLTALKSTKCESASQTTFSAISSDYKAAADARTDAPATPNSSPRVTASVQTDSIPSREALSLEVSAAPNTTTFDNQRLPDSVATDTMPSLLSAAIKAEMPRPTTQAAPTVEVNSPGSKYVMLLGIFFIILLSNMFLICFSSSFCSSRFRLGCRFQPSGCSFQSS